MFFFDGFPENQELVREYFETNIILTIGKYDIFSLCYCNINVSYTNCIMYFHQKSETPFLNESSELINFSRITYQPLKRTTLKLDAGWACKF